MPYIALEPVSVLRDVLLSTFSGNSEDTAEEALRLLTTILSPQGDRYVPKHLHRINTKALNDLFFSFNLMHRGISSTTTILSQRFIQTSNEILGSIEQLATSFEQAEDMISIALLYSGNESASKRKYRVYPSFRKQNDKSATGAIKDTQDLLLEALSALKGTTDNPANAMTPDLSKMMNLLPDKGESILNLKTQSEGAVNAISMSLGSENSASGRVKDVRGKTMSGEWVSIYSGSPQPSKLVSDFTMATKPMITKEVQIVIEHRDALKVGNITLKKIRYNPEGEIAEQVINVGKPIKAIGISEESILWFDRRVRDYLDIVYQVSIDNKEWIQIQPIESDQRKDLPELILINSLVSLPGARNVSSSTPIERFWFKASFAKKGEIPQYLLRELLLRQKQTEKRVQLIPFVPNGPVFLDKIPVDGHVRALELGIGRASMDPLKGSLMGLHKVGIQYPVPKFYGLAEDKGKISVVVGGQVCTQVESNPTGNQYMLTGTDKILFSEDLKPGASILISHQPIQLELERENQLVHKAILPLYSDGKEENSSLYYYEPEATDSFQPTTFDLVHSVSATSKIWKFNTPKAPMSSALSFDIRNRNGSSISSLCTGSASFVSGREATNVGLYSKDSTNGVIYFNAGTHNPYDLLFSVTYSHENKVPHEKAWNFADGNKTVEVYDAWSTAYSTNAANGYSTLLVPPSDRFNIITNSVKVKGAQQVPLEAFKNVRVDNLSLPLSNVSGSLYSHVLPHYPVNTNMEINASGISLGILKTSTGGLSTDGDWCVLNGSEFYYRTSVAPTAATLSYYYLDGYSSAVRQYYVKDENVIFNQSITSTDLEINYQVSSYHLEYNFAAPIENVQYDASANHITFKDDFRFNQAAKMPAGSLPSAFSLVYEIEKPSSVQNVENDVVTLIPEYIDLEVQLA